jgi:hypothetical protein
MVEEMAAIGLRDLGLSGTVLLFFTLVMLGWLIPWRTHKALMDQYDRAMTLLEKEQATNEANADAIRKIAESKDLGAAVVEALRQAQAGRGTTSAEEP